MLIRWSIQSGFVCIPKSVSEHRIVENGDVFDFNLSDDDMKTLVRYNSARSYPLKKVPHGNTPPIPITHASMANGMEIATDAEIPILVRSLSEKMTIRYLTIYTIGLYL